MVRIPAPMTTQSNGFTESFRATTSSAVSPRSVRQSSASYPRVESLAWSAASPARTLSAFMSGIVLKSTRSGANPITNTCVFFIRISFEAGSPGTETTTRTSACRRTFCSCAATCSPAWCPPTWSPSRSFSRRSAQARAPSCTTASRRRSLCCRATSAPSSWPPSMTCGAMSRTRSLHQRTCPCRCWASISRSTVVTRELVAERLKAICTPEGQARRQPLIEAAQRNFRAQMLYE